MKYLQVNRNGLIVNVILWDGSSEYNPGPDITLIRVEDSTAVNAGDKYENGTIIPSNRNQESYAPPEEPIE